MMRPHTYHPFYYNERDREKSQNRSQMAVYRHNVFGLKSFVRSVIIVILDVRHELKQLHRLWDKKVGNLKRTNLKRTNRGLVQA